MKKLIETAVYSIPKLDLKEYCKINDVKISELYQALDVLDDDKLAILFLNRYPREIDKEDKLNGANIIKQILNIKHLKISEIAQTYEVTKRTILRKIKKVEQTDPELYSIYKKFRNNSLTQEDEYKIENMPVEDIQTAERLYDLPKNITDKTHQSDKIFKTKEDIREEFYDKLAEKCEDPEELERKMQDPKTEKLIQNRWKKEKVLIKLFQTECNCNLELLHIELGNKDTEKRILKEFEKIDQEDGIKEILGERYEIKGE